MLTSDYLREISELKESINASVFREAVQLFSETSENFFAALKELGAQNPPNRKTAIRKAVKHASTKIDVFEFHDSSVAFQRTLEKFPIVPDDVSARLLARVIAFKDAYKAFLFAQDDESAIALSWISLQLNEQLQAVEGVWDNMLNTLTPYEGHLPSDYEAIEIRGSEELTAVDFGRVVSQIAEMYALACRFVGVESRDHPLLVVKIESGSLLAKLAGQLNGVGATKLALLVVAADRAWRHGSATGRIEVQSEQALLLLKLRNELHQAGIPVDSMDADIERIGASLTREAGKVVDQLGSLSVDGVETENPMKALSGPKESTKLLGHDR